MPHWNLKYDDSVGSDTSLDIIYSEDSGDESLMALEKYHHQPESTIIIANHNDYTIIVSHSTTLTIIFIV